MRVIWTLCATDGLDERYILDAMERAAREDVSGIELCGSGIDRFIGYREFPQLHRGVDQKRLVANQEMLRRISDRARTLGLRLGLWHHEIGGPPDLLERMPEFRAKDGLIDLGQPSLYRFITGRCAEFLASFPAVDELVLTLTETQYVVAHRPFVAMPQVERIRRVLQAVADATEKTGRHLVIRPFSAIREDELHVRDAVKQLRAERVSLMYKTEPFDWNPFLPDEPLIGSVARYEARAETDAGAEYYGQADFPCCYARYIQRRLDSAGRKGAAVATIRADRGAGHSALDHPLNEVNLVAPTLWCHDPSRSIDECWAEWLRARHGTGSPQIISLLEQTFDVIQKALYIDGQSISHRAFPDLAHAKHILFFELFEENISLEHLTGHWSILPERRTGTHEQILHEKQRAVEMAGDIVARFKKLRLLKPNPRKAILQSLERLQILAEACLQFCRVAAAHTEEMWERMPRSVGSFDSEATRLVELANDIERRLGENFFRQMPRQMRSIATGLAGERKLEIPLRRAMESRDDIADYVLCGFAAEGHRLAKRLHTGRTFSRGDCFVRATGLGEAEGISYELKSAANRPRRLLLTLLAQGTPTPGVMRIGPQKFAFDPGSAIGPVQFAFRLPPRTPARFRVHIASVSNKPCAVTSIELCNAS